MDRSPTTADRREPTRGGFGFGAGECPGCLEAYVLEMEFRCVACDSPLCPLCVVLVTSAAAEQAFCRRCRAAR